MDSMVFKYKHYYSPQQQNQHLSRTNHNNNNNSNNNSSSSHNNNNNKQNSIFILNTVTDDILPSTCKLYYTDLNDNNVVSSTASPNAAAASSSVWSSASSTMCSPAAHAIQKLFSCSSHRNYTGIESKTFKSKSEILKKKSKFWKYLEGEANNKNKPPGIDEKSFKHKSKYWSKSCGSDNQNQQDLSELLEYSCSLCDNCRCVDCQIGYFDCENSDDSNSEYSCHLSAYEEDEDADESDNEKELKSTHESYCLRSDNKQHEIDSSATYCISSQINCTRGECCQQCFFDTMTDKDEIGGKHRQDFLTTRDH